MMMENYPSANNIMGCNRMMHARIGVTGYRVETHECSYFTQHTQP